MSTALQVRVAARCGLHGQSLHVRMVARCMLHGEMACRCACLPDAAYMRPSVLSDLLRRLSWEHSSLGRLS